MNEAFKQAMDLASPEKIPDPRDQSLRPNSASQTSNPTPDGNPLEPALHGEKTQTQPDPVKQQESAQKSDALRPLA